jgi:hypothetical protein
MPLLLDERASDLDQVRSLIAPFRQLRVEPERLQTAGAQ